MPKKETNLFVVGKVDRKSSLVWVLIGIFDEESLALAACLTKYHFIAPAILNEELRNSVPRIPWPGAYFPIED